MAGVGRTAETMPAIERWRALLLLRCAHARAIAVSVFAQDGGSNRDSGMRHCTPAIRDVHDHREGDSVRAKLPSLTGVSSHFLHRLNGIFFVKPIDRCETGQSC